MALQLNRVTGQVDAMGDALVRRQREHSSAVAEALAALASAPEVSDELLAKIAKASRADGWRRGAIPMGGRLDERHPLPPDAGQMTLIGVDGSQIYPDRHGVTGYFMVNVGSIVLRQGSGEAPSVDSLPELFFEEADLFDDDGQLWDEDHVNGLRDRRELEALAALAESERAAGGASAQQRSLLALGDGPLLPWGARGESAMAADRRLRHFAEQMARMREVGAIPVGYIDRPGSAYVLRILELASLPLEDIERRALRQSPFRRLADRQLFADLQPGERTGLFLPTSENNERCQAIAGYRVAFFYMNVAQAQGADRGIFARVEVPDWFAADRACLNAVQAAIFEECRFTGYPYVLARAHELAVLSHADRRALEGMIGEALARRELFASPSSKAALKQVTGEGRA